jgi:hypothetical protein
MNIRQRKVLTQARRWSTEVRRAPHVPDKKRAARKVVDCLLMLISGRAPTDLEKNRH